MKNLRIIVACILVVVSTLVSSCKKCECPAPTTVVPAPSKTVLLVNKNWQLMDKTRKEGYGQPSSVFYNVRNCEKDDLYIYSAIDNESTSGSALIKINTKCYDAEKDIPTTWFFNSAQTEITTYGRTYKILELTNSIFKISYSYVTGGINTVDEYTYGAVK